jgi:phospholipid:diacylglycerol acyltransferase
VNYDTNNLHLAAYDWRLSYWNLEERDGYFSKLKATIEGYKWGFFFEKRKDSNYFLLCRRRQKKKVVVAAHSMGALVSVFLYNSR